MDEQDAPTSKPKADPEAVFQHLVALEKAKRDPARTRRKTMQAALAILVIVAAVVIFKTEYDVSHSLPLTQNGQGDSNSALTESNLNTAITSARYIVAADGGVPAETKQLSGLAGTTTTLSFGPLSHAPSEIAFGVRRRGVLVLTSLVLSPPGCLGVLQVFVGQHAPVFPTAPETRAIGTYYFEAPVSATDTCAAATVSPPAGGQYVSTDSYPTPPLP
jgi:hypothetical protein